MIKKALTIADNESFLRQVSKEVDFNDKSYLDDIKDLREYCAGNKVFALAAIQLGIPKRIIYLKSTRLDKLDDDTWDEARILINPTIISRKGHTKYWEACASCLDNMGLVNRPYEIVLQYYNENGLLKNGVFREFEATVLSHEYDHLNGILHIDIAEEVLKMPPEERKQYREVHPYEIISKDGNFDDLINKQ